MNKARLHERPLITMIIKSARKIPVKMFYAGAYFCISTPPAWQEAFAKTHKRTPMARHRVHKSNFLF